jgi:hypothetical protein
MGASVIGMMAPGMEHTGSQGRNSMTLPHELFKLISENSSKIDDRPHSMSGNAEPLSRGSTDGLLNFQESCRDYFVEGCAALW